MFAAEDFVAADTTFAITARVIFCLEVGFIARWQAEARGAVPVAATRSGATLPIGVSRIENGVLTSLGVISWGGKGDASGGQGSSDENEEFHSVTRNQS